MATPTMPGIEAELKGSLVNHIFGYWSSLTRIMNMIQDGRSFHLNSVLPKRLIQMQLRASCICGLHVKI